MTQQTLETSAQAENDTTTDSSDDHDYDNQYPNSVTVNAIPEVKEFLDEVVEEINLWGTRSEYVRKAVNYYLRTNSPDISPESVYEMGEYGTSCERSVSITGSITDETHEDVKLLVNQGHTPWDSLQDFGMCAIANYTEAMQPGQSIQDD